MNVAYQYCALILVSVLIGSIIGQCDKFKCYRNEIGGKGYLNCKEKDIRDIKDKIGCDLVKNKLYMKSSSGSKPFYSIQHDALSVVQKYFNKVENLYLLVPFEYIKNDTFKAFEASTTLKAIGLYVPSKYLDPSVVFNIFDEPGQYKLMLMPYKGKPMLKLVNLYFKSPNTMVILHNAGKNITCGNNPDINESYEGNGYHVIFYPVAKKGKFEFNINRCSIIRFRRKSVGKGRNETTTKARNEATTKARNEATTKARNEATTKDRNEATTKDRNKANQLSCNIPLIIVFVLLLALMNQF